MNDIITISRQRYRDLLKDEYKLLLLESSGADKMHEWSEALNSDTGNPNQPKFSDAVGIINKGEWDEA